MQQPVKERIARLRDEIAQINAANHLYLREGKKPPGAPEHERRLQRLEEIRDELLSLADWKRT